MSDTSQKLIRGQTMMGGIAAMVVCLLVFAGMYLRGLIMRFREAKKDRLIWLLGTSIFISIIIMSGQTTARYANIMGTFIILLVALEIRLHENTAQI